MYEIGKQRLDGKWNVWKCDPTGTWVIRRVFDDLQEAQNWVVMHNRNKLKRV